MSGDGVPSIPFYRSKTFWSLLLAAAAQVFQLASEPGGPLQFVSDPAPASGSLGDLVTLALIGLAAVFRAGARGRWRF